MVVGTKMTSYVFWWHLDMKLELDESQLVTLGIIIGYNKSDATYGWNGFEQSAELFYSHVTDETVE